MWNKPDRMPSPDPVCSCAPVVGGWASLARSVALGMSVSDEADGESPADHPDGVVVNPADLNICRRSPRFRPLTPREERGCYTGPGLDGVVPTMVGQRRLRKVTSAQMNRGTIAQPAEEAPTIQ